MIEDSSTAENIMAFATLVGSIGALVLGILNRKQIEVVHKATNSMKDQLMTVTRSDALQEGHAQGVKDEKERTG